jgi:hypothetical protein
MLPKVVLEPLLFGLWVAVRHGLRSAAGRARREDVWDLRCRLALFKGMLGPA